MSKNISILSLDDLFVFIFENHCTFHDKKTFELVKKIDTTSSIVCSCLDSNKKNIILVTSEKHIEVYNIDTLTKVNDVISEKKIYNICSFTQNNIEYIVYADKSGYLIGSILPELKIKKFLFGHTASMITDLIFQNNCIISSDRDEKIFINDFPQTFSIRSLCLGHTMFVRKICSCLPYDINTIISGSGDGTIALWSINDGKQLKSQFIDDSESVIRLNELEKIRPRDPKEELLEYSNPVIDDILFINENYLLVYCSLSEYLYIVHYPTLEIKDKYKFPSIIRTLTPSPVISTTVENKTNYVFTILLKDMNAYTFTITMDINKYITMQCNISKEATQMIQSLQSMGLDLIKEIPYNTELMKRTIKEKYESSYGLEKQITHNTKKLKQEEADNDN